MEYCPGSQHTWVYENGNSRNEGMAESLPTWICYEMQAEPLYKSRLLIMVTSTAIAFSVCEAAGIRGGCYGTNTPGLVEACRMILGISVKEDGQEMAGSSKDMLHRRRPSIIYRGGHCTKWSY
jgi:hypothetical protein